jgi:hypothetical protein
VKYEQALAATAQQQGFGGVFDCVSELRVRSKTVTKLQAAATSRRA